MLSLVLFGAPFPEVLGMFRDWGLGFRLQAFSFRDWVLGLRDKSIDIIRSRLEILYCIWP